MPKLPNNPLYNDKELCSLIVFVYEIISMSDEMFDMFKELERYLNEETSNIIKIVPIISDKISFKCVYPVIPNDDIIELIEKASEIEDYELSNLAKSILRSLKLMKLKD
jgi:hypothetical protein